MAATYLDSSALVKLAIAEPESSELRKYLRRRSPFISSALARTEVARALLDEGPDGRTRGQEVLARVHLLRISNRVLDIAATLTPAEIRSLDAIHLATALQLRDEVGRLITYDGRMRAAAEATGLRTAMPR